MHPAGIVQIAWRVSLHDHGLFEPAPEECASGVLANGRLVIGSRAANLVGVAPDTGHIDWVTGVSGGVDSEARFDAARGQVYVGADDGSFYAVDPKTGVIRWTYRGKGAIERPVDMGGDLVYVTTASDRVVALEAATGKWRWQYERDMPEGFTIHGYAGARLRGDRLLAGFADGYLVSLAAATGDVVWAKSLAAASEQFVDVDTTPAFAPKGDVTYVSSYSGGLYALDARDGSVRWRLSIEGAGDVTAADRAPVFRRAALRTSRRSPRRPRVLAAGAERGRRPHTPDGHRAVPGVLRQPGRDVRRQRQHRRAAGDLQPRPRRLRVADVGSREPAPVRAVERRVAVRSESELAAHPPTPGASPPASGRGPASGNGDGHRPATAAPATASLLVTTPPGSPKPRVRFARLARPYFPRAPLAAQNFFPARSLV